MFLQIIFVLVVVLSTKILLAINPARQTTLTDVSGINVFYS